MFKRHMKGLGAVIDPSKPASSTLPSSDASAAVARFLGTDKAQAGAQQIQL